MAETVDKRFAAIGEIVDVLKTREAFSHTAKLVMTLNAKLVQAAKLCVLFIAVGAVFGLLRNASVIGALTGAALFLAIGLVITAISNLSQR
jgi:hypothetical protein